MSQMEMNEFKFPDEAEDPVQNTEDEIEVEVVEDELEPKIGRAHV